MNDLSTDVDYLAARLQPLFKGVPIVLQLRTARPGHRKNPIVTITPGSLFGWPREQFVVAVLQNGSCVVRVDTKRETSKREKQGAPYRPRVADLVVAGIPAKLATVLMTSLQKLYLSSKEKPHGHSTTPSSTSSSTRSTFRPGRPRRCTPFREGGGPAGA